MSTCKNIDTNLRINKTSAREYWNMQKKKANIKPEINIMT